MKHLKFESRKDYYQFLCDKLNENGFQDGDNPWRVGSEPSTFISWLCSNRSYDSYTFLKENGYLDMGLCPDCGDDLKEKKYKFTSGFNPNINYFICKDCYATGSGMSINPQSDKKGCFIATVCYGNINSPEVRLFRKFRDEVLLKCLHGKLFVKSYYFISPSIAKCLNRNVWLKQIVRLHLLDKIHKRLFKKYY